jgi:hypothetical protein
VSTEQCYDCPASLFCLTGSTIDISMCELCDEVTFFEVWWRDSPSPLTKNSGLEGIPPGLAVAVKACQEAARNRDAVNTPLFTGDNAVFFGCCPGCMGKAPYK